MYWNGDCKLNDCERESIDASGLCKQHKMKTLDFLKLSKQCCDNAKLPMIESANKQWVFNYLKDNFPTAWPLVKIEGMSVDIVNHVSTNLELRSSTI